MEQECKGPIHPVLWTWLCCSKACLVKASHYTIYTVYVLVLLQRAVIKMVGLLVEQNVSALYSSPPLVFLPPALFCGCWALLLFLSLHQGQTLVSSICWSCSVCLHHGWNVSSWQKACHLAKGKGIHLQLASLLLCWQMFVLSGRAQPWQLTRGRQVSLMVTVPWTHEASSPARLGLEFRGWCLIRNKLMLQSFPQWSGVFVSYSYKSFHEICISFASLSTLPF